MIVLLIAVAFGIAGIAGWETYTSPGVVFYGIILCLIFVIPVGIVKAMTGVEVTLNVLAEFIGGSWVEGNALAMNYFKAFGMWIVLRRKERTVWLTKASLAKAT